jgi:hypothetical protein
LRSPDTTHDHEHLDNLDDGTDDEHLDDGTDNEHLDDLDHVHHADDTATADHATINYDHHLDGTATDDQHDDTRRHSETAHHRWRQITRIRRSVDRRSWWRDPRDPSTSLDVTLTPPELSEASTTPPKGQT